MPRIDESGPLPRVTRVWCDGGLLGPRNPCPDGVYWSVGVYPPGQPFTVTQRVCRDHHTNNEAEWLALLDALRVAVRCTGTVIIHSDSQIIVRQFLGRYAVKGPRLRRLKERADRLMAQMPPDVDVRVVWVPRREIVERLGH